MPKEQKISVLSGTVTEAEIVAANAAIQAYGFFRQMQGACYRSAIFVRLYLKETHGIEGRTVVGFVNDGEEPIYASHYVVDKFEPTDAKKTSPQGIMGMRYLDLSDLISDYDSRRDYSTKELASLLQGATWE